MKNLFRKILCKIGKHDFFVHQDFGRTRRIGCKYCIIDYGMNDEVRCVIPWDHQLSEIKIMQGYIVNPRWNYELPHRASDGHIFHARKTDHKCRLCGETIANHLSCSSL